MLGCNPSHTQLVLVDKVLIDVKIRSSQGSVRPYLSIGYKKQLLVR